MNSLFHLQPAYPEGFRYFEDFLSIQEEQELCDHVRSIELRAFNFQGFEAKRKVASFGHDYSFANKTLAKGQPIPPAFKLLITKVANHLSIPPDGFAELLLTEYPPGAVINWHRDAFPFDLVAGISLLSDCIFRLRPHEKVKQNRKSTLSFPVARRSLYVIDGPARTAWQHSIAPVKETRYSITLRTLR